MPLRHLDLQAENSSQSDEYRLLQPCPDGVLRSRTFPGLWLDTAALLAEDGAALLKMLQEGLQQAEHRAFAAELEKREQS